jgi:hypothetical protein
VRNAGWRKRVTTMSSLAIDDAIVGDSTIV